MTFPTVPGRPMRPLILVILAVILLMPSTLAQRPDVGRSPASTATAYDPDILHIIKPELREEIAETLPAGLTEYVIDATFPDGPDDHRVVADMTVTYTNTTGAELDAIPLRLYANSPSPDHDAITLDAVTVDDAEVEPEMSEMNSVAMIGLPETLAHGDTVEIEVEFTTNVPVDEPLHYGMLNYTSRNGTWSMAHWYPMVAGWDQGYGWMLKPTSVYGDPVFTNVGMYTVTITAPEDLRFITSGVEVDSDDAGRGMVTTTWSAAPSRDFVMIVDDDMEFVEDEVDGTTVRSWYHEGHEEGGEAALLWTVQAVDLFNDLLGEYPFVTLQLSEIWMFNAAGVEYPQLFTIADDYYSGPVNLDSQGYFEFTVAHEVVHQWFYNIVGNNQYDDAFIDEGITNYLSSQVYFGEVYGDEAGEEAFEVFIVRPFQYMVEANRDVIISTDTDAFPSENDYVNAAYVKAPAGFAAIHDEMGAEAFFGALQAYVEEFRFLVATPEDLLAAFNLAAETDITPLWTRWFERREGSLDIR